MNIKILKEYILCCQVTGTVPTWAKAKEFNKLFRIGGIYNANI